MGDIVNILRDLRWGEVQFANLRYKNYSDWYVMVSPAVQGPIPLACRLNMRMTVSHLAQLEERMILK